ncbi:MAG: putative bifunctional diguanylate cyclase/phosphodiesterase, partial [Ilumatobacteraceae bacterium]
MRSATIASDRARAPDGVEARRSTRGKIAGATLVAALLGLGLFTVWSTNATSSAVDNAVAAGALSDDFAAAARAVSNEESLERKYRLEPGTEVRASYDRTGRDLVAALGDIRLDGAAADRILVGSLIVQHHDYLQAIDRMFAAVDAGDAGLVLQIDNNEVDPVFAAIESAVLTGAEQHHDAYLVQVARLHHLESLTRRTTPLVLLSGLVLASLLAAIGRGHRRVLDGERVRAVHDSQHDALTGLPNRTLLAARCEQALRADKRAQTCTGLLLVDLDRFKEINDTFGHHYGDELLSQVGPRLSGAVRHGDIVARLGGDEFAVLLHDIGDVDAARAVAAELCTALNRPFHVADVDLDVEASIGVVVSGPGAPDPSTLLQHADIAMYVAKSRHCGVFAYDPTVDGHSPAKLALLGDLRRALEHDELTVHYQPTLGLHTGDIVGVEALVRWQHPQRGLVMPDEFIPLAEHTGLMGPITRHVMDRALAQARVWADA